MLNSYVQNADVGMTKAQYLELCETLGNTPVESEIPVEIDDLPLEVQSAIEVYKILRDDWDVMGGSYLGKSLIGIVEIFDLLEIPKEDRRIVLFIIKLLDSIRQEEVSKKLKQATQSR